jgi:membrane-bound serine protease (ClpP class)
MNHLLQQADGRKIALPAGDRILKTKGAILVEKRMGTRLKILAALSDPNIAYILFLLGLAGLYFEFSHPGAILPGIVGGISLILAFFAMQTLPVNYAGILLILFAVALFIAEIKVVSNGILTIGGIVSLVMGSLLLFDSPDPALRVSLKVMIPALVVISLFFAGVMSLVLKAQMRKRQSGREGMVGDEGEAVTDIHETGKVFVHGEYWNAWSERAVEKGKKVRVVQVQGLKLKIEEH